MDCRAPSRGRPANAGRGIVGILQDTDKSRALFRLKWGAAIAYRDAEDGTHLTTYYGDSYDREGWESDNNDASDDDDPFVQSTAFREQVAKGYARRHEASTRKDDWETKPCSLTTCRCDRCQMTSTMLRHELVTSLAIRVETGYLHQDRVNWVRDHHMSRIKDVAKDGNCLPASIIIAKAQGGTVDMAQLNQIKERAREYMLTLVQAQCMYGDELGELVNDPTSIESYGTLSDFMIMAYAEVADAALVQVNQVTGKMIRVQTKQEVEHTLYLEHDTSERAGHYSPLNGPIGMSPKERLEREEGMAIYPGPTTPHGQAECFYQELSPTQSLAQGAELEEEAARILLDDVRKGVWSPNTRDPSKRIEIQISDSKNGTQLLEELGMEAGQTKSLPQGGWSLVLEEGKVSIWADRATRDESWMMEQHEPRRLDKRLTYRMGQSTHELKLTAKSDAVLRWKEDTQNRKPMNMPEVESEVSGSKPPPRNKSQKDTVEKHRGGGAYVRRAVRRRTHRRVDAPQRERRPSGLISRTNPVRSRRQRDLGGNVTQGYDERRIHPDIGNVGTSR